MSYVCDSCGGLGCGECIRNREEKLEMRHSDYLDKAYQAAEMFSGCTKVKVGSLIYDERYCKIVSMGANRTYPDDCYTKGCLRMAKYGDDKKSHRAPGDCRAVHSEIDAISRIRFNEYVVGKNDLTIYVTRYPCENCARAIVSAGIKKVVYGNAQEITVETKKIFNYGGVKVIWLETYLTKDVFH